jgi:hypothetical protein
MTEEQIALARRAVACKGWRWMLGMQAVTPNGLCGHRITEHTLGIDHGMLPDLTDAATLGCLLALVREAWGDPHASVWYDSAYWHSGNRWSWWAKEQSRVDYDTESAALVAALEAAP